MNNAWFPFFPGDYARDTAHLSLAEHGAYLLLLFHYYSTEAPLPAEMERLYRICGARSSKEVAAVDLIIEQFFIFEQASYRNARADQELARRAETKQKLSASGRLGAANRWRGTDQSSSPVNGQGISPAIDQANSPGLAYPQPEPQPEDSRERSETESDFELFWREYPKHVAKAAAEKAWKKAVGGQVDVSQIIAGVKAWKKSSQWADFTYIPNPATFLNGKRWQDEHMAPNTSRGGSNGNGTPTAAISAPAGKYEYVQQDSFSVSVCELPR